MTVEETQGLAKVIRANRFHIQAPCGRAIADYLQTITPGFDRALFFATCEGRVYRPKTGAACSCRPGIERDNCPTCEGTGEVIDFAKIRARSKATW
jgi:DnaJ-class molecular chaperone